MSQTKRITVRVDGDFNTPTKTFELDAIDSPLDWQVRGLQQTASGYGKKLTTTWVVNYAGRRRRLYAICFSNVSSVYFKVRGVTHWVS